jgi:hypothetical protein
MFCKLTTINSAMKFLYGLDYRYVDVTDKVAAECIDNNNNVVLPLSDPERAAIFGDPLCGILKHMRIVENNGLSSIVPVNVSWCRHCRDVDFDFEPFAFGRK